MITPLAESLRPLTLDEIVGQEHILHKNGLLRQLISNQHPLSVLFYGPPGCGKTTLARAYAQSFNAKFIGISAVSTSGVALKELLDDIKTKPLLYRRPFLFIDEIHRYNKAQQDILLPDLERGAFTLVAATTENPSFALNNAFLSRLRVLTLNALNEEDLKKILNRYEGIWGALPITEEAKEFLIHQAQGDGRYLLNQVENLTAGLKGKKGLRSLQEVMPFLQKRAALYDKEGESHYNLISALHKSVRGSDPDAALYWLCRMLKGGEDPLFIARRLIRMAVEDIGLADPQALSLALSAQQTYQVLGSPEGELALAEITIYLALAPKSNAVYKAYGEAKENAAATSHLSPPVHILNAPTTLMKEWGYGQAYAYDHDTPLGFSGQNYFPEEFERKEYYAPVDRGFERQMKQRLDYFKKLRSQIQN